LTSTVRVVAVGASAGGVGALQRLVESLPADLPAAVFVVLHLSPDAASNLPRILGSRSRLPVSNPEDGELIQSGRIYVAQPDHHMLIDGMRISVKKGPKENRFRPSIDALFRSAAYSHRNRVIGVVLSGALDDGTSGLWSIKRFGGTAIVQDPSEALFDSMPLNALEQVEVDHKLAVDRIGPLICRLLMDDVPPEQFDAPEDLAERTRIEVEVASSANAFRHGIMKHGELTEFTCPECHGSLIKLTEGGSSRYRCHTGHAYTTSALLAGITESVGASLWSVTRALEEAVMLLRNTAQHLSDTGRENDANRMRQEACDTEGRAHALQELAIKHKHLSEDALRGPVVDD
jgi:two-component system, chemotaxis family, protein-glutamate methylesterase/glutaminase